MKSYRTLALKELLSQKVTSMGNKELATIRLPMN